MLNFKRGKHKLQIASKIQGVGASVQRAGYINFSVASSS